MAQNTTRERVCVTATYTHERWLGPDGPKPTIVCAYLCVHIYILIYKHTYTYTYETWLGLYGPKTTIVVNTLIQTYLHHT